MICPRCHGEINKMARYGEMINTCQSCGGVWLDKGELTFIIDRIYGTELTIDGGPDLRRGMKKKNIKGKLEKGHPEKKHRGTHGHDENAFFDFID